MFQASEREVIWVMKIGVIVVGVLATVLALQIDSIYGLWYLSSDLVYVILFPQLVCVVHLNSRCNTYGSLCAFFIGLFLRAGGGEAYIGLDPLIRYPYFNETDGQLFPFRTFAMLTSFATLLLVSALSKFLFENGHLQAKYDVFRCVVNIPDDVIRVREPVEGEMSVLNCSNMPKYNEILGRENPGLDLTPENGSYDYNTIKDKKFVNEIESNNRDQAQSRL